MPPSPWAPSPWCRPDRLPSHSTERSGTGGRGSANPLRPRSPAPDPFPSPLKELALAVLPVVRGLGPDAVRPLGDHFLVLQVPQFLGGQPQQPAEHVVIVE